MQPKAVRMSSGPERDSRLIKNIVTTSLGVSIGPLEYCGVGHIVYIGTAAQCAFPVSNYCYGPLTLLPFSVLRYAREIQPYPNSMRSVAFAGWIAFPPIWTSLVNANEGVPTRKTNSWTRSSQRLRRDMIGLEDVGRLQMRRDVNPPKPKSKG